MTRPDGLLEGAQVEVLCVRSDGLAPAELATLKAALSSQDQARAESLPAAPAARFVVGRALLRVAMQTVVAAGDTQPTVTLDSGGKPRLDPPLLAINLSHSGGHVTVACTSSGDVGVDVEPVRTLDRRLAARVLTDTELARVDAAAVDEQAALFTRLWVVKEACLKARGGTLSTIREYEVGSGRTGTSLRGEVRWAIVDTWPGVATAVAVCPAAEGLLTSVRHVDRPTLLRAAIHRGAPTG